MRTSVPSVDLRPDHWAIVRDALRRHVPDREVLAFGSRATWTAKDYSDLDLAVMGEEPLSLRTASALDEALGDSDLPFKVDVVDWARTDEGFRRIIRQHGVPVLAPGSDSQAIGSRHPSMPISTTARKTLGDYFTLQRGTTYKSRLLGQPGPLLLGLATIQRNGGFRSDSLRTYGGDFPDHLMVQPGDLYVSLKDVTQAADLLGAVARLPSAQCSGRLTQDTVKLIPKLEDVPSDYIYWLLRTPQVRAYCRAYATGTTNLGLAREDFLGLRVPDLNTIRCRIVDVLEALDDKIELNRRMNETLEAMARALFKSWFVDFDPVRAKMEGRDTGLSQDIADLFPDRLVDSEMGEIPEGWAVGHLADAIELLSGGTPRTTVAQYWNGGIPWYTPRDAPNQSDMFVLDTQRTITQVGVDNSATKVLPSRTTVISARGTVGRLACLGRAMAMNQTCYGIRGAGGYSDFFVYWLVRNAVEDLRSRTHGTVFDTITRQTFTFIDSQLPPRDVAGAFEAAVKATMERVLSNLHESRTLAALRDALLPKLISGEIRVPDAERLVESVP